MAGNQVTGDGLSMNLAGMSKNQLYDIMSQMKTLIEQNQDQARQILIQNPPLTKALFQAQIMLGMLHPPQEIPKTQLDGPPPSQQATPPAQQPAQNPPLPAQQPTSLPTPSLPLQPIQHNRAHINTQLTPPLLSPQSSNMSGQYSTQPPPSIIQPTLPPVTTPLQPPMNISSTPHLLLQPPLPPLPPQPRPPSMPPSFPHQSYPHMGPSAGFQHQGASQLHHAQPVFHSASRPPTSMTTPFSQGQPLLPNQQSSQTLYQGGGSHVGMDYNQMGVLPERGPNWMPEGPSPPPPFLPPHMTSASQPPRPASLTADMEKALLQQVMSLTQEQINMLPPDQRNQVVQLQQMLRQ